jgi:hypothetical protein
MSFLLQMTRLCNAPLSMHDNNDAVYLIWALLSQKQDMRSPMARCAFLLKYSRLRPCLLVAKLMEEERVLPSLLFSFLIVAIVAHDFLTFFVAQPM